MDPSLAFLDSARDFDTVSLARSTQKALEIILPWCQVNNNNSLAVTKEIQKQALVYAQAIDFSVEAAHDGFAIAEDAIALVGLIPETTPEERREFLVGVQELTQKGRAKAMQAHRAFTNVRRTVEDLLAQMRRESNQQMIMIETNDLHGKPTTVQRPSAELGSELAQGIHNLEEFAHILAKFVAWWNEMEMETGTQLTRQDMVLKQFDKLRLKTIEMKWKDHRKRYAAYCDEIGLIQDRYPAVFVASRNRAGRYPPPEGPPYKIEANQNQQKVDPELRGFFTNPHYSGAHSSNVIISEELSSASYMSAALAGVQVLERNRCLLILQFQCHPSENRRFIYLRINWKFRTVRGVYFPPKVVDIAPKESIGARSEEQFKRKIGAAVPAQLNIAGAVIGPEISAEWNLKKKVGRATFTTGSIRGHLSDSVEWTVAENRSAMTGVPAHFNVAVVVEYSGVFLMELEVVAKQIGTGKWWRSRNEARGELLVDVDKVHDEFPEYKPSSTWREWFPYFTGEVAGSIVAHPQEALRR